MLLQRLATGATGVKQARYRRGPTRGLYGGVMVWGLYSGVNVWGRYGGANVWGENQNTLSIYISIRTVPVKKKLKYRTVGAVAVRYLYAQGTLEVRSRYAGSTLKVRSKYARSTLEVRLNKAPCPRNALWSHVLRKRLQPRLGLERAEKLPRMAPTN